MLLVTGVRAQQEDARSVTAALEHHDGFIINIMSDEEILAAVEAATEGRDPKNFLRGRELQSDTCRATNPYPVTVCGTIPSPPGDNSCLNSEATCAGLEYPCTCSGFGETSCSYCTVKVPGAVACQVTGSSMTFSDTEALLTTCTCVYVGNGQVVPNCFHPTPQPVSLPTFWPVYTGETTVTQSPMISTTVTQAPISYTYYGTMAPAVYTASPVYVNYNPPTPAPVSVTQGGGGGGGGGGGDT